MPDDAQPHSHFSHTLFHYVYRDAGNFKAHGSVLLSGTLSQKQQAEIKAKMEAKEFFIAEQIGVEALYETLYEYSGGRTREDHVWHCFEGFEEVANEDEIIDMSCWGTANELHRSFKRVRNWNLCLSPHATSIALRA